MGAFVGLAGKALKAVLKIALFCGLAWFLIPFGVWLATELITGKYLEQVPVMNTVCNILWYMCYGFAPLTPILFLIDEFPRLGKIEAISNGLATLRSKKIHISLIVQSKSQLNAIYGKDVAEVIADNCSYKAILKASEPTTQEWCSKLVGTYDKKKVSSNYNADIMGVGKGQGTSSSTEEKRIIKPEEFAYLQDVVCVFPNGYKRLQKANYYEDSTFTSKM